MSLAVPGVSQCESEVNVPVSEDAITACQSAAAICRETGDWHGGGLALGNLGLALRQAGRVEDAITAHQTAAAIFRKAGDQQHEEMALRDLEKARAKAARLGRVVS